MSLSTTSSKQNVPEVCLEKKLEKLGELKVKDPKLTPQLPLTLSP